MKEFRQPTSRAKWLTVVGVSKVTAISPIIACLSVVTALAQSSGPFFAGAIYVVHSATRRTAQTIETGLAPGSLCDINIRGLYQPTGSLSLEDTVTLRFRAPGTVDAREMTIVATQPSFFDFPAQLTALIPADTPLGQADVLAVSASGKSFTSTVWIVASGFGVFTKAAEGYGAAAAQIYGDTPRTVGLTTPVRAGEWVTIWGTGLGSTTAAVLVEVAGIGVTPSYSGPAPGLTGVDQINFRFPAGVPDDCYLPLTVTVNARASNITSIAAAGVPGPCHHRLGLSSDALATLDRGGLVTLSKSSVGSSVIPDFSIPVTYSYMRDDSVFLGFIPYDAAGVQSVTGLLTKDVSGCELNLGGRDVSGAIVFVPRVDSGTPVVTGPGGLRIPMEGFPGYYHSTSQGKNFMLDSIPASIFGPGEWAVEVPGGSYIAAFRAALRVPPALRWINRSTVSPVSRERDLTLKWDPMGYTDQEWVQCNLDSGRSSISCHAPATTGSLSIPASLIAQLSTPILFPAMLTLIVAPIDSNPVRYTVPLVKGGVIPGIASFGYLESIWIELK